MNFNDSSTAANSTVTNNDQMNFRSASTAGAATIVNNVSLEFFNTSTAGDATIANNAGGTLDFNASSTGGNAAITNTGTVTFRNTSTGGNVAIINNAGGLVDFSRSRGPAGDGRISAGSIAGAGSFLLGDNELTVGANNMSTTVSGVISDTGVGPPGGSLVKTGAGVLTLSGINTYAGATTVNGGTLALSGAGSIAGSSGVSLGNAGTVFDISATAAGATIQSLSGVAGSSVALGNQTLTLSNASGTFGGVLSGTGGLTLNAGTQTLTGINTYAGATTVNGGTLLVDGSIASSSGVTVNSGGTAGGTGTLPSVAVNGGTLSPGPPVGTLNVQGNLSFTPTATYQVDISPTAADRTLVAGTAALAGRAHVIPQAGSYPLHTTYTILTAAGGISGTFSSLDIGSAFLCACLSYDTNNVYLEITSTGLTFAGVGQTSNQIAVGAAVEQLGTGNPIYDVVVLGDAGQARRAFDLLSGEAHASLSSVMLDDSRFPRDVLIGRLRQSYGGRDPLGMLKPQGQVLAYAGQSEGGLEPQRAIAGWVQSIGAWGHNAGDGNASALARSTGGFLSGVDAAYADMWRVGIAGGHTQSALHVDDRSSSAALDNYHLAVYGGGQFGALALRGGVANSWHDLAVSRSIAIAGGAGCCASVFRDTINSEYRARTIQTFGEVGLQLSAERAAIEPFANAAYVNLDTDGFSERGGSAALRGNGRSQDATFTSVGARAALVVAQIDSAWLTAHGALAWRHALGDVTPGAMMTFASGGSAFFVAGAPLAVDAALLEAGIDLRLNAHAAFGVSYAGQFSGRVQDHAAKVDLIWRF